MKSCNDPKARLGSFGRGFVSFFILYGFLPVQPLITTSYADRHNTISLGGLTSHPEDCGHQPFQKRLAILECQRKDR